MICPELDSKMGTVQDLEFEVSCLGFRVPSSFGFRVSSADYELWISGSNFEFRVLAL